MGRHAQITERIHRTGTGHALGSAEQRHSHRHEHQGHAGVRLDAGLPAERKHRRRTQPVALPGKKTGENVGRNARSDQRPERRLPPRNRRNLFRPVATRPQELRTANPTHRRIPQNGQKIISPGAARRRRWLVSCFGYDGRTARTPRIEPKIYESIHNLTRHGAAPGSRRARIRGRMYPRRLRRNEPDGSDRTHDGLEGRPPQQPVDLPARHGAKRPGRKQFAEMGLQIRQRDHVGLRHLHHRRHE